MLPVMKSMTGYGRGEATCGEMRFEAEVSSVNRKQLDVAPALPREAAALDGEVRKWVAARASRGRVSVRVRVESLGHARHRLEVDRPLLEAYREAVADLLGDAPEVGVQELLRMPGVLEVARGEADPEALQDGVREAVESAMEGWNAMRSEEGEHLAKELRSLLDSLEREVEAISERAPEVPMAYRAALMTRLEEAGIPVDLGDDRLVREVALFAERCDITEELTRLRSHCQKFRGMMRGKKAQGRSLDFLVQEMNREANTIGSKANDADLAHRVVAAKSLLEKIREQVQNVE